MTDFARAMKDVERRRLAGPRPPWWRPLARRRWNVAVAPDPVTHDYGPGKRFWGHDYSISKIERGGHRIKLSGWSPVAIREGDFFLLENEGGRSTRYRVESITWARNPDDMFHAELIFAPRENS